MDEQGLPVVENALFTLNPALDPAALATEFARERRLQIRDVLTDESARAIQAVLAQETPWGLAWQAGRDGPHPLRRAEIETLTPARQQAMTETLTHSMQGQDYGFLYTVYPLVTSYLERWAPGGVHETLLESLNSPEVLDLIRQITGFPDLVKADGQATLYSPNQFLSLHTDEEAERGRRVAYVLSLCTEEWRPDWGGYLNFFDKDGDIIAGYRPRFNALNLFAVPQDHNVSMVPWFAPAAARFAITGWFRDW